MGDFDVRAAAPNAIKINTGRRLLRKCLPPNRRQMTTIVVAIRQVYGECVAVFTF